MTARRRTKKKAKPFLDELADLMAWWGRRQKRVAARRKKRAAALKDRNDAADTRKEARELRAQERQRHIERTRTERILAAQRRQARIAAAGPVVRTVKGTVWPTETVGGHGGTAQAQPGAVQCGAPTLDGTACQNLVTDGKCSAGHIQRKRNRVTGTPLSPSDARFYARRDEGYRGPLDKDGNPVTRATEGKYRR